MTLTNLVRNFFNVFSVGEYATSLRAWKYGIRLQADDFVLTVLSCLYGRSMTWTNLGGNSGQSSL